MNDPIEQIVRQVLARSPIAARAMLFEPHYVARVETTIGALRAVHRASYEALLSRPVIERAATDLLLHPEGLHAADLAMREQALAVRQAETVPFALLVEGVLGTPLAAVARRYGVDLDHGMTVEDAVTRIVEQVRARG